MQLIREFFILFISGLVLLATIHARAQDPNATWAQRTPEQLHQLVAPIALYPDVIVAQVLAASTYPAEVVQANDWLQNHPHWKGKKLAKEANKQH